MTGTTEAPTANRFPRSGSADDPISGPGGVRRPVGWARAHRGLLILLVIPVAVTVTAQLFGRAFLDGDNFLQNFPMRVLVGQDLRHGVLPLWNPYLSSGTPLLGGFNAGAAYPTTWLMAVLPAFTAWTINLALAYDVALAGMYLFLRRQGISTFGATFGAAAFAFAGYLPAQIVHIDLVEGAAWLPWMLVAIHGLTQRPDRAGPGSGEPAPAPARWWVALLAVSFGLSLLSGSAEAIIDSSVLLAIYLVGRVITMGLLARERRRALAGAVAAVAAGLVGGLVLGAAQAVSGLAFLAQSQRDQTSYAFFGSGSLPARLVSLLVSPFVLGTDHPQPGSYAGPYNFAEVTSYMGILALIATCSLFLRRYRTRPEARHWWVWYVVAGVGLLSALGTQTPFGRLLFLLPVVNSERLLNRNLLLVDFSMAVLLAWWVHLVIESRAAAPSPTPGPTLRERWASGRRAEIVVTCAPLAVIAVFCLFLWLGGPHLQDLLQRKIPVSTVTRLRVAGLVTAGAVVAAAATWIVLCQGRLPLHRLRRLLVAVLVVDLVLFDAFLITPPITQSAALARGTLSAQLQAQVGGGRFIIYDPDQFQTPELYRLGQTDLNIYRALPSGQGYTALSDKSYYNATGAHYQEDLNPATLVGSVWNDLNATTMLSLPSYFVTPLPRPAPGPTVGRDDAVSFSADPTRYNFASTPVPGSYTLAGGRSRTWYFGGVLTVHSLTVPLLDGPAAGLRVGLVTTTGGVRWLPSVTSSRSSGPTVVQVALPGAVRAGGLVVTAAGTGATVGTPTAVTAEAGAVALNGRMQYAVVPPHWRFTGSVGSFGVFRNTEARGWAWVQSPGGGPPPTGSALVVSRPDPDGRQEITVRTTAPSLLVRSETWNSAWRATVVPLDPAPAAHTAPVRVVPVGPVGLEQGVGLPGPGRYRVTFTYGAGSTEVGLAVSVVGGVGLVLWAVIELAVGRRRRRART